MSGFGNERQIIEALNRYLARPQYIEETLFYFYLKEDEDEYEPLPRIDIISVSSSVLYICYLNC